LIRLERVSTGIPSDFSIAAMKFGVSADPLGGDTRARMIRAASIACNDFKCSGVIPAARNAVLLASMNSARPPGGRSTT